MENKRSRSKLSLMFVAFILGGCSSVQQGYDAVSKRIDQTNSKISDVRSVVNTAKDLGNRTRRVTGR